MVFSEPTFLFGFLPFVVLAYLAVPRRFENALLLAASLVFYVWGEGSYVIVLLVSIALNYGIGLGMDAAPERLRKTWLWLGIAGNLVMLGYYKYWGFILENLGIPEAARMAPKLPVGISFFTFQAMSYVIDLYYRRIAIQRSFARLALYVSMFPQLIAGPIVRYSDVEAEIGARDKTRSDFVQGMERFVLGLAKKALLADPMGQVADQIFSAPLEGLSPAVAWTGISVYAAQIFFDFSAYSDMAIGLGRVFGFTFPENFNYPYISRSATEFWRRWHLTLSTWFRDYVYIPLGGNRVGPVRAYFNVGVVFVITGVWHGAGWTFVIWGAYYGVLVMLEKWKILALLEALPRWVGHVYFLLLTWVGWILFRSEDMAQTGAFARAMFLGETGARAAFHPFSRYVDGYVVFIFALAVMFSIPLGNWVGPRLRSALGERPVRGLIIAGLWACFILSLVSVGAASYSPFIYFRF